MLLRCRRQRAQRPRGCRPLSQLVVRRIADLLQRQPVGRQHGHLAVAHGGGGEVGQPVDRTASGADLDQSTDQAPHHRVAEGVRAHGDLDPCIRAAVARELEQGTDGRGPLPALAEGAEVAQSEEGLRRVVQSLDVQRAGDRGRVAAAQRVRDGAGVTDPVAVAPPDRPESCVEAGRCARIAVTARSGGRARRSRRSTAAGSDRAAGVRSTCTTWPRACTPASVRPAHTSRGGSGSESTRPSQSSSSPCTVRRSRWVAQPEKSVPS